jgi:hypothetical protein
MHLAVSGTSGGAIYVENASQFNVTECVFENISTALAGGAVVVGSISYVVSIINSDFSACKSVVCFPNIVMFYIVLIFLFSYS